MKSNNLCCLRSLLGCLVFTLVVSSTTLVRAQPQVPGNIIYLPLVQQNSNTGQTSITIEGTVEEVLSEHPAGQPIFSRATVHIEKVIDGVFTDDRLLIHYLGGTVDGVTLNVSDEPVLITGMRIRAKVRPLNSTEYAIFDVNRDLSILNAEVFTSFHLNGCEWPETSLPVTVQINPNTPDVAGDGEAAAVRNAMNTWSNFTGSFFEFRDGGNTSCNTATDNDGINCATWKLGAKPNKDGALATAYWACSGGVNSEVDLVFWEATTTAGISTPTQWSLNPSPNSSEYSIEYAALHELGHGLGLGHEDTEGVVAVMNGSVGSGPQNSRLFLDDQNGIAAIYTPQLPISSVDRTAAATNFTCTSAVRCRTVLRGVKHVANNGTVRITAGNYPETMVINRAMTLASAGGVVTIGQ